MNPNIQKRIAGKQAILHLLGRLKGAASATPPKAAGRGPNT
jgi:hypothetical protein